MGAPNYAYKEIMNWAKDAYQSGYKFNSKTCGYKNKIMELQKFSNLEFLRPEVKQVVLPKDNLQLQVTCFNFTTMLFELLKDTRLNQMSNLVVNYSDPFGKYTSPSGKLSEINSGYWYQKAYETMVLDPNKDFLMPIIFALDRTTIASSTNLHVFVIMFTMTIFD